jgi:hypothetical protein
MFLTTLPAIGASINGSLPLSASWTSFFLPKIAEQGFGIPVRTIDGDYLPAFRKRIEILLKQEAAQRGLYSGHYIQLSKSFSPTKAVPPPFGNALPSLTARSLYQVDELTAEALVGLLILKDGRDLEPLGLTFPDGLRTLATSQHRPYLHLLQDLEARGILAGISYFYNEGPFVSSYPPRKDVRTIHVDGRRLLQPIPNKTQKQVLDTLGAGALLDADAVPLLEVFEKALRNGKLGGIRGLSASSNTFATHAVAGRESAVGSVTKVTVF